MIRFRALLLLPLVLVLLLLLMTRPPLAGSDDVSLTMNSDRPIATCEDLDIYFGDDDGRLPMVRDEVTLTATAGSVGTLRADLGHSQGMTVLAEDRKDYGVNVCLAAASRDPGKAQALLGRIQVSFEAGRVAIEGPENSSRWLAYVIARVPRSGAVDLSTENGPIEVRDLEGSVVVEATNGPLSLESCSGTVKATSVNGPIAVAGSSGEHHLRTQNGPIAIALHGTRWSSGSLDARSDNGPLSLVLPADYRSGVRVDMSEHSPFVCKGSVCAEARRTWSEGRKSLELGESRPQVHLATINGPVVINRPGDDEEDGGV